MTTAAYAVRQLDYTFQLGQGQFGAGGFTTLTPPSGLRSEVHIEFANTPTVGMLHARIYGLSLDHMNQISKAGLVYAARRNLIQVRAGDTVSGMTTVFSGAILEAYPDMASQPSTPLVVIATPTNLLQVAPADPVSFSGPTNASTALGAILAPAGVTLENNGVNGVLSSPYFPGSTWDQTLSCVRALGCYAHYDGISNTLAIWPKDGARSGEPTVISPARGLINYPSFQAQQIIFRVIFDPGIMPFAGSPGRRVNMQSGLVAADGLLKILAVDFDLSAQLVDGPWEMTVTTVPVNQSVTS